MSQLNVIRVRRLGRLAALALALPAIGAACSDDDVQLPSFSIATYNAGLAQSYVDYASERAPLVVEALGELDVDALCVQEVWTSEDWDALKEASSLTHALRIPAMATSGDASAVPSVCEQAEVDALGSCVRSECDVAPGQLTGCALTKCQTEVFGLSADCQGCITGVIGELTIDEVVAACGPDGEGASGGYAYEGSFGIGLLSSAPFTAEDTLILQSTTNRRGVVYGQVDAADGQPVHIFCTHLTANLSDVPYTGPQTSWAAEQAKQIAAIQSFVNRKAKVGERIILLGDMNTGPKAAGIAGELPKNYAMFEDGQFDNRYLASGKAACTFCQDNPLQPEGATPSVLIDHILLRGWDGMDVSTSRIMREPIIVRSGGTAVDTAYSDHYGLRAVLEL